ncbi:MAG: 1-(5-phosphoribosyl)-5-[(5-phosphoribosylamino)methylideneamino]imidazole-4-carboxamide isomerase [Clostridiales bacterium]|nr:1-(5-phosphoribosyl)-5-[(5-phosphoribosylamino)methylideneamino]imidazole-4-carboxamide isomerase [Clostridiales bacterium]
MLILPAIDLCEGKAVRLKRGEYDKITVYSDDPPALLKSFEQNGAAEVHVVDLEGARDGTTPNLALIRRMKRSTSLIMEVGGGIRSMDTVNAYLEDAGVDRVILGTAAVTDPVFLEKAVQRYGERIAVGADIKDGCVAIRGWTEKSDLDAFGFCRRMRDMGVKTLIVTDISRDGMLAGANLLLYEQLTAEFALNIIASGGVSSVSDIAALKGAKVYGAIIGKALYEGAVDLKELVEAAS